MLQEIMIMVTLVIISFFIMKIFNKWCDHRETAKMAGNTVVKIFLSDAYDMSDMVQIYQGRLKNWLEIGLVGDHMMVNDNTYFITSRNLDVDENVFEIIVSTNAPEYDCHCTCNHGVEVEAPDDDFAEDPGNASETIDGVDEEVDGDPVIEEVVEGPDENQQW